MKEKAPGRTESEKERTRETCDEVVSGFVRSTAAPSILSKALYIPGRGFPATEEPETEEGQLVSACGIIKNTLVLDDEPQTDNPRLLDVEECSVPIPYEVLRSLHSWLSARSAIADEKNFQAVNYLLGLLDETIEVLESCGVETPSAASVRIASGAAALGCYSSENKLELEYLDKMASIVKNAMFDQAENADEKTLEIAVMSLYTMILSHVFSGFSDMSGIAEKYRGKTDLSDPVESLYADSFFRLNAEISTLSQRILSPFRTNFLMSMKYRIPGLQTLMLVAERVPDAPEFWFTPDFRTEKTNAFLFENGFSNVSATAFSLVDENQGSASPRTKKLLEGLQRRGLACLEMGETAANMSRAVSGKFDIVSVSGAKSAWFEHALVPVEIRVRSPLETRNFFETFDELAEVLPLGMGLRIAFALDAFDAFAPAEKGIDVEWLAAKSVKSELPVHETMSDDASRWLVARLKEIMENVASGSIDASHVNISLLPDVVGELDDNRTPLFISAANAKLDSGCFSTRDAVALLLLLGEKKILESIGEYLETNPEAISVLGRLFGTSVSQVSNDREFANQNVFKTLVAATAEKMSKALSDRPGAVRRIASEARSMMGRRERETFFPNL